MDGPIVGRVISVAISKIVLSSAKLEVGDAVREVTEGAARCGFAYW